MLLHSLDGHLFSVEDTRGKGGFHISLFKDLTEVFDLSGTGGGNHLDRYLKNMNGLSAVDKLERHINIIKIFKIIRR